ncbi:class I SAM-dependent methyltransferase [Lentzea albidocapillata]
MGCGTGRVTSHLESVARTVGIDPSPPMPEAARKRMPAVDLRIGELSAIPAADGEFDHVYCIRGAFSHLIILGTYNADRHGFRARPAHEPLLRQTQTVGPTHTSRDPFAERA